MQTGPAVGMDFSTELTLDLQFGDGGRFLAQWQAWRDDPSSPRLLHYVGVTLTPVSVRADHPMAVQLNAACDDLAPGFHRISFDAGAVSLTLCIGETLQVLSEMAFQADVVWMSGSELAWDKWALKTLARRCRRGTRVCISTPQLTSMLASGLREAGFQRVTKSNNDSDQSWIVEYDPPWTLRTTRNRPQPHASSPSTCAVIGAGLSGASVAHSLAVRGWQVTVFDSAREPAGSASGLPVGLVVPHVSGDDSPRSRLSRAGARLMLAHAQQQLQRDQDWAPSGVMEHLSEVAAGGTPNLRWHERAGWIKPAALVKAWLNHPGIRFVGDTCIGSLEKSGDHWQLMDGTGREVHRTAMVIVTNAMGCAPMLKGLAGQIPPTMADQLEALHAMYGMISIGKHSVNPTEGGAVFPPYPVNGHGSLVPLVPIGDHNIWAAGATYSSEPENLSGLSTRHHANWQRLHTLLPTLADALRPAFANGALTEWHGQRCVSHDRLPLVGRLTEDASAWICVGMGSRGLSFSALCAELLVALLGAEPLPIEASLVRSLDAHRPRRSSKPSATDPVPGAG